jgi:heme A synthase
MRPSRYARFAWLVLAFNVAVIAWGALVRATGSGAGCGDHWPECGGDRGSVEMLIELTHRLMTGADTPLVIALVVLGFRAFPRGHLVRASAVASLVLLVTEALIGAALVKLGYVKDNVEPMRAAWMGGHLLNTNFMLAAMTATAFFARFDRPRVSARASVAWPLAGAAAMVLLTGMTGAIAALADTLFHSSTLPEGMAQDGASGAHLFLRLRALHPLFAVLAAAATLGAATVVTTLRAAPEVARAARVLRVAVVVQVVLGVANLLLLAPVAMQLVHLVIADGVWIALVVFALAALTRAEAPAVTPLDSPTPARAEAA